MPDLDGKAEAEIGGHGLTSLRLRFNCAEASLSGSFLKTGGLLRALKVAHYNKNAALGHLAGGRQNVGGGSAKRKVSGSLHF